MQKIPLEIVELHGDGYHTLIDVCLFDLPFKMVLDTGASKTVFDKNTLLQSGIEEERIKNTNILSSGLGTNTMESFLLELTHFEIGNWKIKKFTTTVLDLSTVTTAYQQLNLPPIIGVLGGDILVPYAARIDYQKKMLTLRERKVSGVKI